MPLERMQRLAAMCITGAMKTTITATLEISTPTIDLMAEKLAAKRAGSIVAVEVFTYRTLGDSSIGKSSRGATDYMTPPFNWERCHTTIEEEGHKDMKPGRRTSHIYTDGSKTFKEVEALFKTRAG